MPNMHLSLKYVTQIKKLSVYWLFSLLCHSPAVSQGLWCFVNVKSSSVGFRLCDRLTQSRTLTLILINSWLLNTAGLGFLFLGCVWVGKIFDTNITSEICQIIKSTNTNKTHWLYLNHHRVSVTFLDYSVSCAKIVLLLKCFWMLFWVHCLALLVSLKTVILSLILISVFLVSPCCVHRDRRPDPNSKRRPFTSFCFFVFESFVLFLSVCPAARKLPLVIPP